MNRSYSDGRLLIDRLRSSMPLLARARQKLVERLGAFLPPGAARGNLLVTDLYDVGEEHGLLCQLDLSRHGAKVAYLVVPFEQLALDRRYGVGRRPQRDRKRVGALRA